ncbi:hypothetical protein VP01_5560g1, partial [Puccinia sorghi]
AAFKSFFEDKSIDLDDAEYWFEIDALGIDPIATTELVLSYPKNTSPASNGLMLRQARQFDEFLSLGTRLLLPIFLSDTDIIEEIRRRSSSDARLKEISNKHLTKYSMVDGLFYHRN